MLLIPFNIGSRRQWWVFLVCVSNFGNCRAHRIIVHAHLLLMHHHVLLGVLLTVSCGDMNDRLVVRVPVLVVGWKGSSARFHLHLLLVVVLAATNRRWRPHQQAVADCLVLDLLNQVLANAMVTLRVLRQFVSEHLILGCELLVLQLVYKLALL